MKSSSVVVLNGKLMQEAEAMVSPFNRGMMYGDGCFETLKSYNGKFLGWGKHFERLKAGLDYLELDPPFTSEELAKEVIQLIEANQLKNVEAMIRIQCWRNGSRGYSTSSRNAGWMMQASVLSEMKNSVDLILAETRCIPAAALERKYKLSNGLNYIKAAQEAKANSCDDALMLTINDMLSETTSANIFWIKGGEVFTPSTHCDLLPGITRNIIIECIDSLGLPLHEGEFRFNDIENAESVFCTNSLIEMKEVASIGSHRYETHNSVLSKIKKAFEAYKSQELSA